MVQTSELEQRWSADDAAYRVVIATIAQTYEPEAQQVAALPRENPFSFVIAPHGFGKSRMIIPRVTELLEAQGLIAHTVTAVEKSPESIFEQLKKIPDDFPPHVILLDRAYQCALHEQGNEQKFEPQERHTREIVDTIIHLKNCRAIAFITCDPNSESDADYYLKPWVQALGAIDPEILRFDPKPLSPILVREFATATNLYKRYTPLPEELFEYIVRVVPPYMRPLHHFLTLPYTPEMLPVVYGCLLHEDIRQQLWQIIPEGKLNTMIETVTQDVEAWKRGR